MPKVSTGPHGRSTNHITIAMPVKIVDVELTCPDILVKFFPNAILAFVDPGRPDLRSDCHTFTLLPKGTCTESHRLKRLPFAAGRSRRNGEAGKA